MIKQAQSSVYDYMAMEFQFEGKQSIRIRMTFMIVSTKIWQYV